MTKSFFNMSVLCFVVSISSVAAAKRDGYVPGEVLIRYKNKFSITSTAIRLKEDRLVFASKIEKTKDQSESEIIRAKLSDSESVEDAIRRLSQNPNIEYVQPNFKYKILSTTPNDPKYGLQWGLRNTEQSLANLGSTGPDTVEVEGTPAVSGKDMNLPVAWDLIKDCNVVVAVIDSGIKYDHEDLAANMWDGTADGFPNHGRDTINVDNDPMDDNGHGTHVAGTIGAVGNNALGTTGVCWSVKLMAVKALRADGSGDSVSIAGGITWAVDHGAKVINMSISGDEADPTMLTAMQYARDHNVVVVSAAGNQGTNNTTAPLYPCNYRDINTVCVAALGQNFKLASFSNYSTTFVDVGAPGINILSTWSEARTTSDITFASGWNKTATGSAWGAQTVNLGGSLFDGTTIPAAWDGTVLYAHDSDARMHKDFAFPTASTVWLQNEILNNLENGDHVNTFVKTGVVDPFTGGTLIGSASGKTGSVSYVGIVDVSPECKKTSCTVGYQFTSNSVEASTGAVVHSMKLISFSPGTTGYNITRGTSMAAPHVAGLAALLIARNPLYTAADVAYSIKYGGISSIYLSGKTTTGKTVTATGSLAFIRPPTGVTAVQDQ